MAVSPSLPDRSERESILDYADALAKEKLLRLQLCLGATSLLLFATLVVGGFVVWRTLGERDDLRVELSLTESAVLRTEAEVSIPRQSRGFSL